MRLVSVAALLRHLPMLASPLLKLLSHFLLFFPLTNYDWLSSQLCYLESVKANRLCLEGPSRLAPMESKHALSPTNEC